MEHTSMDSLAATAEGNDPFAALASIRALRHELDRVEASAVHRARADGAAWQEIATLLGVSRQAVHKKYGRN